MTHTHYHIRYMYVSTVLVVVNPVSLILYYYCVNFADAFILACAT